MKDYRICENKYGYFKIQKKHPSIKIFGITIRRERFSDSAFFPNSRRAFDTIEEAQEILNNYIISIEKNNRDWIEVINYK